MKRIAVIAALPGELGPLVRGWSRDASGGVALWRRSDGPDEWVAACAGAGSAAAARAFAGAEREGPIDVAVSAGWAGALGPEALPGRAYTVSAIVDARTGDRMPVPGAPGGLLLVTNDRVADRDEKRRLASATGAALVDMEAATVARLAAARGIAFRCVKGVSDGPDDRLPDFNRFLSADGGFRAGRFAAHALIRPWLWPVLLRLRRNSRNASWGLREAIMNELFSDEGTGYQRQFGDL
jgi:adenosylhomocysteine nucleosidase